MYNAVRKIVMQALRMRVSVSKHSTIRLNIPFVGSEAPVGHTVSLLLFVFQYSFQLPHHDCVKVGPR